MIDILSLEYRDFETAVRNRFAFLVNDAADLYRAVFSGEEFTGAPWTEHFFVGRLSCASFLQEEGPAGVTSKFGFVTQDGYQIESVLIPMSGGSTTLCLSSQVGCARGCSFCETGKAGLIRNLGPGEIVSQVYSAMKESGVRPRNLVFMGMGEPLDNLESVAKAIAILRDQRAFAYSLERITVCTSGQADGIRRLGQLGLRRLNVSISLNAATDSLRSEFMPVNRITPLADLQAALVAYPRRRNFVFGINYCLIPGRNDSAEDADAIARFLDPVGRVLVNLIPYNPGSQPVGRAPTEGEIEAFIDLLMARKIPVRRRLEKGRSLMAACGQLGTVLREQRSGQK